MPMTDAENAMVKAAVESVHAAKARGDKSINLDTPAGWTRGDSAWERAVIERLNLVGHAKQVRGQSC